MSIEIGHIEAIFRYPVKSMRGLSLEAATLGWQGLEGDRRFALRRLGERGGFPWLTASKLPALLDFTPDDGVVPTLVRTPDGEDLPLLGDALAAHIARRHGAPVEVMHMQHGIFDEASISVITSETVREVCQLAGTSADARRFRPNIVVRATRPLAFDEDAWVGGVLAFGDADDAPAITVTMRDLRCVMVNLDPDGGPSDPGVMRAVVQANEGHAGIYATVTRTGPLAVGQPILLRR